MNLLLKRIILFFFVIIKLNAYPYIDFTQYDPDSSAKILESVELPQLWDWFLKDQVNLYFDQEAEWFSEKEGWKRAQDVLELGSGNGAFLFRLSDAFQDKIFLGVEKKETLVQQANHEFGHSQLFFIEGDAEKEYEKYQNQFDAVIYRFTLQHLINPKHSLELVHRYLKDNGFVFIIDAYDSVGCSSHGIDSLGEAAFQLNERNRTESLGDRLITMKILEDIQNHINPLSELYEVAHTSLDTQGNLLEKGILFFTAKDRKHYFNYSLLFLTILKKAYQITIDLSQAYKELTVYLQDESSWVFPGMHLLVLKKINHSENFAPSS